MEQVGSRPRQRACQTSVPFRAGQTRFVAENTQNSRSWRRSITAEAAGRIHFRRRFSPTGRNCFTPSGLCRGRGHGYPGRCPGLWNCVDPSGRRWGEPTWSRRRGCGGETWRLPRRVWLFTFTFGTDTAYLAKTCRRRATHSAVSPVGHCPMWTLPPRRGIAAPSPGHGPGYKRRHEAQS